MLRQTLVLLFALALPRATFASAPPGPAGVDLHAHLYMGEATERVFRGNFTSELRATHWKDRISSRVNAEDMDRSGARIVVVALYTHVLFKGSQREQLRRQLAAARDFVTSRPGWALCTGADQATRAITEGKRCLVLSLEGADGALENKEDFDEFITQGGIRIVAPLHFTDDPIGGPALLPGLKAVASPWGWIRSWFSPRAEGATENENVLANPRGLTPYGHMLVRELIRRGVWIDITHASDLAVRDLVAIQKPLGIPLLHTHTALREYYRAERGLSRAGLEEVRASGGVIGVLPSTDMMDGTKPRAAYCPPSCQDQCESGVPALAEQYTRLVERLGEDSVMFGTDINAPIPVLPSGCPSTVTAALPDGYVRYSHLWHLWEALRALGAPVPANLKSQEAKFLRAWAKASGAGAEMGVRRTGAGQ